MCVSTHAVRFSNDCIVTDGVKQDGVLSPLLFNVILKQLLLTLKILLLRKFIDQLLGWVALSIKYFVRS